MAPSLSELVKGLRCGEFRLVLEPQFDLHTGRVIGLECLSRWQHPERGLLSPAHFLPALERHRLMTPLTLQIVERALRLKQRLRHRHIGHVAVNLSASSLQDRSFADALARLAESTGEPLAGLTFELTESATLTNDATCHETLLALSRLGITLSLDDFWTGYSSLDKPHLDRFDEIKVDFKLTAKITHDRISLAGMASILSFANNLGWRCVVEGIETAETLKRVRDLGGKIGQGYYFSRPIPEGEFDHWLETRSLPGYVAISEMPLPAPAPLHVDEAERQRLDATPIPIWLFNLDHPRMEWANPAGVHFWLADSLEELQQRDFESDLSPTGRQRIQQLRQRLSREHSLADQWTVFPRGQPRPCYSVFERRIGPNGDFLVLVRGYEGFREVPSLRLKGELADASPIAMVAFGADGTLEWRNLTADRQLRSDHLLIQHLFESRPAAEAFIERVFITGEAQTDQPIHTQDGVVWQRLHARLFRDPETGRWTALSAHTPIRDLMASRVNLGATTAAASGDQGPDDEASAVAPHG